MQGGAAGLAGDQSMHDGSGRVCDTWIGTECLLVGWIEVSRWKRFAV